MTEPKFKNMPKPKVLCSLSWEDIYEKAQDMDHELTREQIIEIFDSIDSTDWDSNVDFWSFLENEIERYFEDGK